MEISYKREIKHNYLVVAPEQETGAGYEAYMLSVNEIRGLMPMHIRYQDGSPCYYYDITSRQPLNRLLETRFITREEIGRILIQIHRVLGELDGFFLSGEGILLNPELIYVEPELFQVGLCLVPGKKGDFAEQLSRFLQYILKRVNHKDRECVVLAYGMYQESLKDHCGIDDILQFISPSKGRKAGMGQWTGGEGTPKQGSYIEAAEQDLWAGAERDEMRAQWDGFGREVNQSEWNGMNGGEKQPGWSLLVKQTGAWLAVVVLVPAALWLFGGMDQLQKYVWPLVCLDGGLLLVIVIMDIVRLLLGEKNIGAEPGKRGGSDKSDGAENSPWRILFEDEEEPDPLSGQSGRMMGMDGHRDPDQKRESEPAGSSSFQYYDETFQTTLLTGENQKEETRFLKPMEDMGEEIPILYYPFVIGKNKNLVDYVLQRDGVSRIHLRIDEKEGQYSVTDLNSTNGTRINGRFLDANETVRIKTGDELLIADAGYIFS